MNKLYYTAQEVAEMLGVSRGQSYKIIQQLNKKLADTGKIVVRGKVPKKLFSEYYYGGTGDAEMKRSDE